MLGNKNVQSFRAFKTALLIAAMGLALAPSLVFAQLCPSRWERAAVARINNERARHALPALAIDMRLVQSAREHSEDMATNDFFSHTGSAGTSFAQRVVAAGYPAPRRDQKCAVRLPGPRRLEVKILLPARGAPAGSSGTGWVARLTETIFSTAPQPISESGAPLTRAQAQATIGPPISAPPRARRRSQALSA